MASAGFYQQSEEGVNKITAECGAKEKSLLELYARWEFLEGK